MTNGRPERTSGHPEWFGVRRRFGGTRRGETSVQDYPMGVRSCRRRGGDADYPGFEHRPGDRTRHRVHVVREPGVQHNELLVLLPTRVLPGRPAGRLLLLRRPDQLCGGPDLRLLSNLFVLVRPNLLPVRRPLATPPRVAVVTQEGGGSPVNRVRVADVFSRDRLFRPDVGLVDARSPCGFAGPYARLDGRSRRRVDGSDDPTVHPFKSNGPLHQKNLQTSLATCLGRSGRSTGPDAHRGLPVTSSTATVSRSRGDETTSRSTKGHVDSADVLIGTDGIHPAPPSLCY
jgi:hypothetical protein